MIGGPSGAGKTTLCRGLQNYFPDRTAIVKFPIWNGYLSFVEDPRSHAFRNQLAAMRTVAGAIQAGYVGCPGNNLLLADSDPVRVHLVHSWLLWQDKLITDVEWDQLCIQFERYTIIPTKFIILRAPLNVLRERIIERSRPEDTVRVLESLERVDERWRHLATDSSWSGSSHVTVLDADAPADDLCNRAAELILQ